MTDSDILNKAIDLINKSKNILITTHNKPDGDAIGSVAAMCDYLVSLGKEVKPLLFSEAPQWYQFLLNDKMPVLGQDIKLEDLKAGRFGSFDLIIILDTNSPGQLPGFKEYLKQVDTKILVIDHHRVADGLGGLEIVESEAAATGLLILEFLKYANFEITQKTAEALFVAVATDTGWFRFNNTDSRVFSSCAELIKLGANPSEIYQKLYESFSQPRFMLMTGMLNTLELHLNDRFATMQITKSDFERTGAVYADTENLINESRRIKSLDTSALFIELDDGRIRCSLRSKGAVDVGVIAGKFGGGGHKMAAGAFIPAPMENAKKLIIDEVSISLG